MRIIDLIAHWKNDALALIGMVKDFSGNFHHAVRSDLEERQVQGMIRAADEPQLQAWQAAGARVALTLGTPGWADLFREHEEEDKRLLEYFVDGSVDSWEKTLRQQGAVQQHRRRLRVTAYGQIRLGIRAEEELTERQKKKRKKEPDNGTVADSK